MTTFTKNNPEIINALYQHTDLNPPHWVSMAVNKSHIAGSLLTKELDILTGFDAYSLKIADHRDHLSHQLWKNNVSIAKVEIPSHDLLNKTFNPFIDRLLEGEINHFQRELNLSVPSIIASELQLDDKALEWIEVSFKVLENAIIESFINSDFLFQALVFMGDNPKTNLHEIRVIVFNLDILYRLLPDGTLRVQIFNDKAEEFGSSKKASLEGDFKYRKREMMDELTKLLSAMAPGIKLNS